MELLALYGPDNDIHLPSCTCLSCQGSTVMLADMDSRFKRIPKAVLDSYLDGVWLQDVLPNRLHKELWQEHYTRMVNAAEIGFAKRFNNPASPEEWQLFQNMQDNLRSFAAAKQHRMTQELRALMLKYPNQADWQKKSAAVLKRHERYLKVELQAATAKANAASQWQEIQRRKYLYPNLRYETAGDERVRESHKALDNIVRPVDDPFWDTYYPPNGWGCRCVVLQTDAAVTPARTVDFLPPKGFRNNPGKDGKIFGDDHPYFDTGKLDKAAIETQSKALHAGITRDEVRDWAKDNLVEQYEQFIPGLPELATITNSEVKNLTGKPHRRAAWRNNLLYILQMLTGERLRFVGQAADKRGKTDIQQWYYYLLEIGGEKYYLNFALRQVHEEIRRVGLYAISDEAPDWAGPP